MMHGMRNQVSLVAPTGELSAALALINRSGRRVVEPGRFDVVVGTASTDLKLLEAFWVESALPNTKNLPATRAQP